LSPSYPSHLRLNLILSIVLLIILPACSPLAPSPRATLQEELPPHFSLYSDNDSSNSDFNTNWWEDFYWTDLDALVKKALAQNLTLKQVWARLQQAQAITNISNSDRWPNFNYSGSANHNRNAHQTNNNSHITTSDSFTLALTSSYELDLWGRVAANINADTLSAQASADDWRTAQLSIAAQVTQTAIKLTTHSLLIPLAQQRWQRAQQQLQLLQLRYNQGMTTAIDIAQQRRRVAEYRAMILPLEEQKEQLNYELALLLGELPSWNWTPQQQKLPQLTPLDNIGIPSDLLAQRPDVRAAGLRLQAADWSVTAARADRLPAIRLSADGNINSNHINDLFDNWLANLAASVSGPLFDGGRRNAVVKQARAGVDERLANYKETVLSAMKEVESALMQEDKRALELQAIITQVEQQQQLCEHQQWRYINGDNSYLSLLENMQTLNLLQQRQLQQRRDLLLARTALHQALGGSIK